MVAVSRKRHFSNFRVYLVAGLLALSTTLVSCQTPNTPDKTISKGIKAKVLRMGYQSSGDVLRARKVLEKRLTPLGITVEWSKFINLE